MIRTVLVDDEPLANEGLELLLAPHGDFEVVGSYMSGAEAIAGIRDAAPDLVFLDVQMPRVDGFGVLAGLAEHPLPKVVFVTAHDRHAVRAFEAHALDFLSKPVDAARFAACLERVRADMARDRALAEHARLRALLAERAAPVPYARRITARAGARTRVIDLAEIEWVEARGNYVAVQSDGCEWLVRTPISALEAQVDPAHFRRIHRSTLVRVDAVRELVRRHGECFAVLAGGAELKVARNRVGSLREAIGTGR